MNIGDKVKLKASQDRALPTSLSNYLDARGLSADAAVFTVSGLLDDGARVDFEELDTLGGYYPSRFEVAITPAHEADVAKIAAAFLAEVTSRGGRWLDVYDTAVASLNEQLTVKIPARPQPVSLYLGDLGYVTVQAGSSAEALTKAREALTALAG